MRRWVVPGLFAVLALLAAEQAIRALGHAFTHPTGKSELVALYYVLRTSVTGAFAVFTLRRPAPRRHSREPAAFIACAMAMIIVMPIAGPGGGTATARVLAGDLIAAVACAWLLASVLTLGTCFGVLPEARGLVTRGPYRLVRHPVYLGEIVALAGLAVSSAHAWNVVIVAPFAIAQWVRMGLEEHALSEAFPEYRLYASHTGRLLPRLRTRERLAPAATQI
jgi:protein-S-isoprenylcysteine O-methyltransferase Ste14